MSIRVEDGHSLHNVFLLEVNPDNLDYVWDRVKIILQPAVDRNETLVIENVYLLIKNNLIKLYIAIDNESKIFAAFAIEKVKGLSKSHLRVVLAAGEPMKDWIDELIELMDRLTKECGYEFYEMIGRHGWKKVLKNIGYESDLIYRRKVK